MPYPLFDRRSLDLRPLEKRKSKFAIAEICVDPDAEPPDAGPAAEAIERVALRVIHARARGAPVVLCHGAHLIKNGLGPLVGRMVEEGWLQHVATNGAGSIHDWEFAYLGQSTEDVKAYVSEGQFGLWQETGRYIGLALLVGALEGRGYGESVGRLIADEGLDVPPRAVLAEQVARGAVDEPPRRAGAAADLLEAMDRLGIPAGRFDVPHPYASYSLQHACCRRDVPFTIHPGIGQDIIYAHPYMAGGAVGRAAMTDFLAFSHTITGLEGGVYLSVGSSVMSPMIFEKSLSMARNLLRSAGGRLEDYLIAVNDLTPTTWDWSRGEPPVEDPAYYVRYLKSFSRMGGEMAYVGVDNRVFLTNLLHLLRKSGPSREYRPSSDAGEESGRP